MDSATGLLDAEQNLGYRVSALAFNMSNGPQIPSQPNTSKNNIFAFWQQNMAGVQACAPASNVNQFNFTNNITLADHNPTGAGTNVAAYTMQKAPGAYFFSGSPTVIQNWANNFYFLTVNGGYCAGPGSCSGTINPQFYKESSCGTVSVFSNFAAWQTFGEDSGSSVTTNPGFTNTTACTTSSANWPYPTPGVCDDYSFINGIGPNASKFSKFATNRATTNVPLNGFGSYSGSPIPVVPQTFLTAVYPASDF